MKNNKLYIQSELNKGNKIIIAWIPEEFAVIGKVLKIKDYSRWEDGWTVVKIYGTKNLEHIELSEKTFRDFQITLDS
jgi:hypothetical protein